MQRFVFREVGDPSLIPGIKFRLVIDPLVSLPITTSNPSYTQDTSGYDEQTKFLIAIWKRLEEETGPRGGPGYQANRKAINYCDYTAYSGETKGTKTMEKTSSLLFKQFHVTGQRVRPGCREIKLVPRPRYPLPVPLIVVRDWSRINETP